MSYVLLLVMNIINDTATVDGAKEFLFLDSGLMIWGSTYIYAIFYCFILVGQQSNFFNAKEI